MSGGLSKSGAPFVTVVLNTYNRRAELTVAISSVLNQTFDDWEIVVVDDGSTDETLQYLSDFDDPRVLVLHHPNMGLTASRNVGAAAARGAWLVFLDDDDTVESDWLEQMVRAVATDTGIVFCGHRRVGVTGFDLGCRVPVNLGSAFLGLDGSFLPGTWLMRRDVFEDAGGYLDGLPFIHQYELLIRAVRSCRRLGLRSTSVRQPLLRYTVRDSGERPMQWPQLALDGGRWIAVRHRAAFAGDKAAIADHEAVVGVAAARTGRRNVAVRHLWRSLRAEPTNPKRWGRLAASLTSWGARRVWGVGAKAADQEPPLRRVHDLPAERRRKDDHLFLPWLYERNTQASADVLGMPYWEKPALNNVLFQEPVYKAAQRLIRRTKQWSSVLDVGTGSGVKLERFVLPVAHRVVGFDQGSGIELARRRCPQIHWMKGDLMSAESWSQLEGEHFDLLICADVIEHVEEPVLLLQQMTTMLGSNGHLLISTPDRLRFDRPNTLGPPDNPRHVREWTAEEFELLLESVGLAVIKQHKFLPRGYRATVLELKRQVWRMSHGLPIPDRRSNMAFLCRQATTRRNGGGDSVSKEQSRKALSLR